MDAERLETAQRTCSFAVISRFDLRLAAVLTVG
jgi:hypothetical protein